MELDASEEDDQSKDSLFNNNQGSFAQAGVWLLAVLVGGSKEVSLYSATKQQAERLLRSLDKRFNKKKLYPMILRQDCTRLERAKEATWSEWWFKIPVSSLRGGVWCPIQIPNNQYSLLDECSIRECKLIRKGDHWSLHIVVQREEEEPFLQPTQPILAVDLGEVRPATAVLLQDGHPRAHIMADKRVRKIRMHYNWLRQKLGKKKCLSIIKKIGRTERRKVDAQLHKLSKDIVQLAKENNTVIVKGDLSGIREGSKSKSKRFRTKIARMPSYRMAQFIEYKAHWAGILVYGIDEAWTSKICHVCGSIGRRSSQGLFLCDCGLQYNADLNGAINIGRRFLEQVLRNSGSFDKPRNFRDVMPSG